MSKRRKHHAPDRATIESSVGLKVLFDIRRDFCEMTAKEYLDYLLTLDGVK